MIPLLLMTPSETRNVAGPVPITPSASVGVRDDAWWLAADGENLFENPLFEGSGGFSQSSAANFDLGTDDGVDGYNAYRITGTGALSSIVWYTSPLTPGSVAPGDVYTVSAWIKTDAASPAYIRFHDGNGYVEGVGYPRVSAGDWTYVEMTTAPMPSTINPNGLRLYLYGSVQAGETVWLSKLQIEKRPYATPFIAGDMGDGFAWTGTPHASTSTRAPGTISAPLATDPATLLLRIRDGASVTTHHIILTDGEGEAGGATITYDGTTLTIGTTDEVEVVGVLAFEAPLSETEIARYTDMAVWQGWRVFGELPASNVVRPNSPPYIAQTRIWRCDREGRKIEELPLDMPVQGTITCNEDTRPARKLSLEVNDPDRLEPFRDWIMPQITLTDAAGISRTQDFGLYMVTPPRTKLSSSRYSGTIEGMGVTWRLLRATVANGRTIPAGTDHGAAARSIVLESGISSSQVNIPDTGTTLASAMRVDHGDRIMDVATALLNAANWYAPYMINAGQIVSAPTQELGTARATIRYSADRDDVQIIPDLDEDPNWDRLRNKVTVRNIAPSRDPIYWTETITNPSHPLYHDPDDEDTYPVWLSETVNDPQIENEAAARTRARRLLSEGASYYRPLTVRTVLDMDADMHDVIALDLQRHGKTYDGLWFRRAWQVQLRGITAVTESQLWRIEPWE